MKYRFNFLVVLILVFLDGAVYGQSDQFLNPIDIFDLEYVSNPQISPDGKYYSFMAP